MARKIEIQITGDADHFQKSLGKASGSADSFGKSLARMGGYAVAAIGAAGIGGLALTLRAGIKEFAEAAKVGAQTNAVLKSTGGIANVTSKQVSELAGSLMRKSGVDDEAIQSGENLLLTFTNVRNEAGKGNDVFDQATAATLNLSVAMGKDMSSSAILVGKALQDPVKGLTALSRAGVQFSAGQKEMITSMVAAGDTMGAQKVILAELNTQFGGSAEALGKTLPGQINILKESFSNMAGEMVGSLVPAFTSVMNSVSGFVQRLGEAEGARAKLDVVWGAIKSGVETVGTSIRNAFNAIDWGAVGQTLMSGLQRALQFLAGVNYGAIISGVASKVFTTLKSAFNAINWGQVGDTVGALLITGLNKIGAFVARVDWNKVGQAMVHGFGVALKSFASFLAGVDWGSVLGALVRGITAVLKGLAGIAAGMATAIGRAIIKGIRDGATALWGGLMGWFQAIPGKIKGVFSGAGGWLIGAGTAVLQGFWDGLKAKWDAVASWVGGLGSKIQGLKGPESKDATLLTPHGKAIILGLETGMMESWATLAPKISALGGNIISNFILGVSAKAPAFTGKLAEAATNALEAARAVVEGFQTKLGDAFGRLGEYAKRAFEAKVKGMADGIAREFEAKIGGIKAFQASLTPAELQLQQMDAAEQARQRASALTAAQAALSKAETMDAGLEKEAAVAAAKEQIRVAENASIRVALEEQAAVERTHRDQAAALQIAFLEEAKAKELANLEERTAQQGAALEKQLGQLQTRLAAHPKEYDKIQAQIIKLLNSYGVSFKNSGLALGNAFAAGIRASVAQVERAAKAVAEAAAKYLPHSPAEKGPLSKPVDWSGYIMDGFANTIKMAASAASGPLGGGGTMGAARPAAARPAAAMSGGGGGNTYHFAFPHYVGDRRELVDAVRTEVRRATARNG